VEFELDAMPIRGPYNPRRPRDIGLWIKEPSAGVYWIDDLVLLKEHSPLEDLRARSAEETFTVADFELPDVVDWLDHKGCDLSRVPAGKKKKSGNCLRWEIDGSVNPAGIYFFDVPLDITQYRSIRFRVRGEKPLGQPLAVKLQCGFDDALTTNVENIGKKWKEVEILIPEMRDQGFFLPRRLENFGIFMFRPKAAVVYLDDIRLVKGESGWRYSEKELKAVLFGKSRARKAKRITTPHFDLYTDSKAAVSKFPDGLEKAYSFVKTELGIEDIEEPLPVYIFQSSSSLQNFLVEYSGLAKAEAVGLHGIANGRYLAAYYQAPESSFIVRQVTRSLVHRAYGREGGSWFQDGVAKYLEFRWRKESAAEEFAARVRSGKYAPLGELLTMGKLFREGDARGGASSSDALSRQSAAFYEFLIRGPLREKWEEVVRTLASAPVKDKDRLEQLKDLLGMSISEIEKAWVEWGSRPPPR